MTDTIEKYIPSVDLKKDIYIYLATNYKDITNDAINGVKKKKKKNKDRLNAKSILFLLNKINSKNIIESLLNKIESFTIKEEELFSPEKEFESFPADFHPLKKSVHYVFYLKNMQEQNSMNQFDNAIS